MKRVFEEDKNEPNSLFLGRSSCFSYSENGDYSGKLNDWSLDEENIDFFGPNDFDDNYQNSYFRRQRYYSDDENDEYRDLRSQYRYPVEFDYADFDLDEEVEQEAPKQESAPVCWNNQK